MARWGWRALPDWWGSLCVFTGCAVPIWELLERPFIKETDWLFKSRLSGLLLVPLMYVPLEG